MSNEPTVDYYVDSTGNDCYRICLPETGTCSIVSSAHLIEERKTQLLRAQSTQAQSCPQ